MLAISSIFMSLGESHILSEATQAKADPYIDFIYFKKNTVGIERRIVFWLYRNQRSYAIARYHHELSLYS